jgi:hypothetical protein
MPEESLRTRKIALRQSWQYSHVYMTISRHSNNKLILIKKKHSYDIKSGYIIKAGSQVQVMLYYFEKEKT